VNESKSKKLDPLQSTNLKKMEDTETLDIPELLPVLVLRDIVVFPYMIVPLYVGRSKSKRAVDRALNSDRMILLLTQKDPNVEDPGPDQLYMTGTVGLIVRMLKLPDGRMRVLVQGVSRVKVTLIKDNGRIIEAKVRVIEDKEPKRISIKDKALIKSVREKFEQTGRMGKQVPNEIFVIVENIEEPGKLADIIAANLDLKISDSAKILAEEKSMKRLSKVYEFLTYELEVLNIQNQINMKAQG
jgi:ATP-dependent Lon protease